MIERVDCLRNGVDTQHFCHAINHGLVLGFEKRVESIVMQQVIIGSQTAIFEFALKAIGSLIALVGAYLAAARYLDEKRKANVTARTESQKPFSAKQQEIYFDLLSTTALISTREQSDEERQRSEDHFWVLFWGAVPMVANQEVAAAVNAFSEALDFPDKAVGLRNASMDLARACRRSLGKAWNIDFQHFPKSEESTAKSSH